MSTTINHVDLASVRELRRTYVEQARRNWVVIAYQGTETYTVEGWDDGTGALCNCRGYERWHRCKHATAYPLMLDELERRQQAQRTTLALTGDRDTLEARRVLSTDERRRLSVIRAVLAARGVRPTAAERAALVERGRLAAEELAG